MRKVGGSLEKICAPGSPLCSILKSLRKNGGIQDLGMNGTQAGGGTSAVGFLETCLVGVPQNDHPTRPCKAGSPGHCTEAEN